MREVRMPQLGQTMSEGTILKWLRREGETLRRGALVSRCTNAWLLS
jgi:pyruvate/2-oxoglutarate dehydrogenase complex dihydrolipoamide acyltransferase (E2) component